MMRAGIVATFCLTAWYGQLPAQEAAKKLSPPEAASIAKGQMAVQEVFGRDIEKAKSSPARKLLATKMLSVANDSMESLENRWVLYLKARDLASEAGEIGLAIQIVEDLLKTFAVERREVIAETADKLPKSATAAAARPLIDLLEKSADEALQVDDYANGVRLFTTASRVAQNTRDALRGNRLDLQLRRAKALAKEYEDVVGIDEHMGKFQCFRKNNWAKGLPLLVNSQDADLAAVVKKDLTNPTNAQERVELGDAWRAYADKFKGDERIRILRRAWHWHRRGGELLGGLARAKIEQITAKEIADIESLDAKEGQFSLYSGTWRLSYGSRWIHEYRIVDSGLLFWLRETSPEGRDQLRWPDTPYVLTRKGDSVIWYYDVKKPPEKLKIEDMGLSLSAAWEMGEKVTNKIGKGHRVEP